MIKDVEKAYIVGRPEASTKAISLMTFEMGTAKCIGRMVPITKGSGLEECKMGKANM